MALESENRPWGSWHVLDEGDGYKVKRIEVKPQQRLSYQTHEHRAEHWVIVSGKATCVLDGETVIVGPGECVDVAIGAAHRITNQESEDLVIIEVQRGHYTGEDDIVRLRTTTAGTTRSSSARARPSRPPARSRWRGSCRGRAALLARPRGHVLAGRRTPRC